MVLSKLCVGVAICGSCQMDSCILEWSSREYGQSIYSGCMLVLGHWHEWSLKPLLGEPEAS